MIVLGCLLAFCAALALVRWLWPERGHRGSFALQVVLAIVLAPGLSSITHFLCLIILGPDRIDVIAFDIVFLGGGALAIQIVAGKRRSAALLTAAGGKFPWGWAVLILVMAAPALWGFIREVLSYPMGAWDAWSIWNLRARFLFRGGEAWTAAFSQVLEYSHPDYPLLLPASVARLWTYLGHEAQSAPAALAGVFTFGVFSLLVAGVWIIRSAAAGVLAGAALLGTTYFVSLGTWQYADVPLSCAYLGTVLCLCLHDRFGGDGLLTVAGLFAGLAAWTKNEGLLFAAATVVVWGAIAWRTSSGDTLRTKGKAFLIGLVPVLSVILCFKVAFAPTNDMVSSSLSSGLAERLFSSSRHILILKQMAMGIWSFGHWTTFLGVALNPVPLIIMWLLLARKRAQEPSGAGLRASCIILPVVLAGYYVTYLAGSASLEWQLQVSLKRLLIHLWPAALFLAFISLKDPEEAWADWRNRFTGHKRPGPV